MPDPEQTTDDRIREAVGIEEGGDPEGTDVQAALTSPTAVPEYLSFLNDKSAPGAANVLGENVEMDKPAEPSTKVGGKVSESFKGATLSPLETRGYQAPDVRDPLAAGAAAIGAVGEHEKQRAEAIRQEAEITARNQAATADILRAQQAEELNWANVDERVANDAAAEAHKYVAAYQSQIAAVRQMTVDPTGPVGSMDNWSAAGLSLAKFAEGFLAARGVHIDVSGQIDKWVDRSIHEQERRIQQAQAGAEDQLHLWEIARQTSRDQAEARQRYRGWVIAATQTALQARAAQYQSELASADANDKIAALQVEADKTKYNLWANTYQLVHADRTLEETHRHDVVEESIQQRHYELQAEMQKAKLNAAKAAPGNVFYSDPGTVQRDRLTNEVTSGGKNRWYLRNDVSKEIQDRAAKEADTATAGYADVAEALDRLEALRKQAEGMGGPGWYKSRSSEAYRMFDQQRNLIAAGIKRSMEGLRGSDRDQELYQGLLKDDQWLAEGTNAQMPANLKEWAREHFQHVMDHTSGVGKIGEGTPQPSSEYEPKVTADPGTAAVGKGVLGQSASPADEVEHDVQTALASGRGGLGPNVKETERTPLWTATMGDREQSSNSTAVDDLVTAMVDPEFYIRVAKSEGHPVPDTAKVLVHEAYQGIQRIAQENTTEGAYAKSVLDKLQSDPNDVIELSKKRHGL